MKNKSLMTKKKNTGIFAISIAKISVLILCFVSALFSSQIYISEDAYIHTDQKEYSTNSVADRENLETTKSSIYVTSSVKIINLSDTSLKIVVLNKTDYKKKKRKPNRSKKQFVTKDETLKKKYEIIKNLPKVNFAYHGSQDSDKSFGTSKSHQSSVAPTHILKLNYIHLDINDDVSSFAYKSLKVFYSNYSNILFGGLKGSFSVRPPPFSS